MLRKLDQVERLPPVEDQFRTFVVKNQNSRGYRNLAESADSRVNAVIFPLTELLEEADGGRSTEYLKLRPLDAGKALGFWYKKNKSTDKYPDKPKSCLHSFTITMLSTCIGIPRMYFHIVVVPSSKNLSNYVCVYIGLGITSARLPSSSSFSWKLSAKWIPI